MNDVSLRDLMETKFNNLDRRIDELKRAIEKMAENTVAVERFNSTYHKVAKLEQAVKDLDDRLDKSEGFISIWRYIGATVITILVALIIGWLSGRLNL